MGIFKKKKTGEEQENFPAEEKVSASERFTMVWTAFLCLFLPCVAVLLVIVFLTMLMFGLL